MDEVSHVSMWRITRINKSTHIVLLIQDTAKVISPKLMLRRLPRYSKASLAIAPLLILRKEGNWKEGRKVRPTSRLSPSLVGKATTTGSQKASLRERCLVFNIAVYYKNDNLGGHDDFFKFACRAQKLLFGSSDALPKVPRHLRDQGNPMET